MEIFDEIHAEHQLVIIAHVLSIIVVNLFGSTVMSHFVYAMSNDKPERASMYGMGIILYIALLACLGFWIYRVQGANPPPVYLSAMVLTIIICMFTIARIFENNRHKDANF